MLKIAELYLSRSQIPISLQKLHLFSQFTIESFLIKWHTNCNEAKTVMFLA